MTNTYATTLHESVASEHAANLASRPGGALVLEQYRTRLRHHYWGSEYEDAIGQPLLSVRPGQIASFATVHSGIAGGTIGRFLVRAGGVPRSDASRAENAELLADLPSPFGAFVAPGQGTSTHGDGRLEWIEPVEVDVPSGTVTLAPRSVPLEIGTSQSSRTLLHLLEEQGVARWPYGHDWITILVALGQPFARPDKLLAERRRRYLAEQAEPLPHQEASET